MTRSGQDETCLRRAGKHHALSPIAAVALALTMAGAALTHLRRKEMPAIVPNAVLGALAAFVAFAGLVGF